MSSKLHWWNIPRCISKNIHTIVSEKNDDRITVILWGIRGKHRKLVHKPKLRYKDCVHNTLKKTIIMQNDWKSLALNRSFCRKTVCTSEWVIEINRLVHEIFVTLLMVTSLKILRQNFYLTCNKYGWPTKSLKKSPHTHRSY